MFLLGRKLSKQRAANLKICFNYFANKFLMMTKNWLSSQEKSFRYFIDPTFKC